MIVLQYDLKLISKDNEKIFNRAGKFFLSDKFKRFEDNIKLLTTMQYRKEILEGDLKITITAGFKDKRHSDCSNLGKGVLDALQGIVYKNDRQIKHFECTVLDNEPRDSFIVTVESLNDHTKKE